jgi:hypothetical protein
MVSEGEFEAWLDHPITRWVMDGCRIAAASAKAAWVEASWESGKADEKALTELRTRADSYEGFTEATLDDWASWHKEEE